MPALQSFLRRSGLEPGSIHGGYLATGWQSPVTGNVFVAGDAAGQCLPLTGEGIRTAVLAGERLGVYLREVLDRNWSLEQAATYYRAFVVRDRLRYRALIGATVAALVLPRPLLRSIVGGLARPRPRAWFFQRYLSIFAFGSVPLQAVLPETGSVVS